MVGKKQKIRSSKNPSSATVSPQTSSITEPVIKQRKRKVSVSLNNQHQPSDRDPRKKLVHLISRVDHLIPLLSASLCSLPQSRSKVTDLLSHLREAVSEAFTIVLSNSPPELRDQVTKLQVTYVAAADALSARVLTTSNLLLTTDPTIQTTCDAPVSQCVQAPRCLRSFPATSRAHRLHGAGARFQRQRR